MSDKDSHDSQQETPIDSLSGHDETAIKRELGVKEEGKPKRNGKLIIIVGIVVAAVLLFMMFSPAKKVGQPKPKNEEKGSSYSLSEAKNENQKLLAQMGKNKQVVARQLAGEPLTLNIPENQSKDDSQQARDQELRARMNMAMKMSFTPQQSARQSNQVRGSEANVAVSGLAGGNGAKFANSQSVSFSQVKAEKVAHPEYTVVQGEMLHGVLTTAIDNELAGMVGATLTRPVYSYNDERILLPVGSRLVGQFRAGGGNAASSRIFVIWNRVITPDGLSAMINSIGADTLGRSGQGADYIDNHFF